MDEILDQLALHVVRAPWWLGPVLFAVGLISLGLTIRWQARE